MAVNEERDAVLEFFSSYPPKVNQIAASLRALIRAAIPDAREMLDPADRVVGYGFGSGYADLICTIIPSKGGVKLGIVRGAEIPDRDGLLEGAGKKHRYVAFTAASQIKPRPISALLRSAVAEWRKRSL